MGKHLIRDITIRDYPVIFDYLNSIYVRMFICPVLKFQKIIETYFQQLTEVIRYADSEYVVAKNIRKSICCCLRLKIKRAPVLYIYIFLTKQLID